MASLLDNKPREERDFTEFYPDLDADAPLPFFEGASSQQRAACSEVSPGLGAGPVPDVRSPEYRVIATEPHVGRFGRVLLQLGFDDHRPAPAPATYVRPFGIGADARIEEVIDRKRRQVEYDHDEQDELWLQQQNRGLTSPVSPEVFEILITQLETDWDQIEQEMAAVGGGGSHTEITLHIDTEKYGDDDGIVQGSVYDQRCAVCNDSECTNANAIVFCDGCDIAVHQECYGVAFIPEGEWLCRKCMLSRSHPVDCVFCASQTGAFKQLDNSLWSHVVCAMWIPEVYFANPIYMEPIEGIGGVPKNRWKLTCYICKQRVGACIQCGNKNCFQAYHVTCAKRAGLHMELAFGVQGGVHNRGLISYCDRHGTGDPSEVAEGIDKTRRYFRDIKSLRAHNAQTARSQQAANRANLFRWKTDAGTPIAPQLVADRIYSTVCEFRPPARGALRGLTPAALALQTQEELRQFCNDLCKYWCLKRELKKGAPLIRKNNNLILTSSIIYGSNAPQEIADKQEFAASLLQDLDRLIALLGLTVARQQTAAQVGQCGLDIAGGVRFPVQAMIAAALMQAAHACGRTVAAEIDSTNQRFGYNSVDLFWADVAARRLQLTASRSGRRWMALIEAQIPRLLAAEARANSEHPVHLPFATLENGTYQLRPPLNLADDLSDVDDLDAADETALRKFLR